METIEFPLWLEVAGAISTALFLVAIACVAFWLHFDRYLHLSVSLVDIIVLLAGNHLLKPAREILLAKGFSEAGFIFAYGITWVAVFIAVILIGDLLQSPKWKLPPGWNIFRRRRRSRIIEDRHSLPRPIPQ